MKIALQPLIRKSLVALVVVAALGAGFLTHGGLDASSGRSAGDPTVTETLDPSDLLLAASSSTGIHLRFTGIGGSRVDHTNDIPMESFQFGVSRAVSGIGPGSDRQVARPDVSEVTLTHSTDSFSMPLLKEALSGGGAATATLFFTKLTGPGGTALDYLTITLEHALVTGFSMSSGGDNPSESLSLNFTKMTFRYKPDTGPAKTVTYDLATGVTS